jgi:type IV pilus assembly protein PilQ
MMKNWRAIWVVAFCAALLFSASPAQAGSTPLVRVDAVVDAQGVRIDAKASGPFEFTTYRPSDTLFVVDFAGVSAESSSVARVLKSDVVSSYRVLQYRSGDRAIVRLEILLRAPVEPRVERDGLNRVSLIFGTPSAAPVSAKATVRPPAKAAAPAAGAAIRDIEITRVNDQTQVRVIGSGQLAYEALRLSKPERLVLDFAGASVRTAKKTLEVGRDPVVAVRLGQFKPGVARVVIDLTREVSYSVSTDANGLTVAFGSTVAAQAPQPVPSRTEGPAVAREGRPVERYQVVSQGTAAPVTVEMVPAPVAASASKQQVAQESKLVELPANLTQPSGALATPQPAKVEPAAPAAAPEPAVPQARPAAASQQVGRYTGEPISVNFKDVDLKDFFRLIHEVSGLNVVVDPGVKGSLTLVMEDVPWDQILDIVLQNNNLDKQIDGNVLRVATRDALKREAEVRRDLTKAQAEAVDQVTSTRVLSYAKATNLRDTLRKFLSSRGEILADERSNTLIIRDIPSVLPEIDNLIKQLDRKSQQVEIEARVVAATRTFARDIGTQFGFATTSTGGRSVYGGLVGSAAHTSPISTGPALPAPPLVVSGSTSMPLSTNFPAAAATSGASFIHRSPNFALDFILSAAESKGVGKLLSKPRLVTQNNEKATVKQGTKIPVQTVINNTISVQFIDAVLRLEVTPQITADGTVFMEVVVENTAIDSGVPRVNNIPALSTQSAETRVTVADGETVVIGGVIISQQRTDISQVPLIGSIPLIGHLFKRTSVSTSSQELLFFITPRIVPG